MGGLQSQSLITFRCIFVMEYCDAGEPCLSNHLTQPLQQSLSSHEALRACLSYDILDAPGLVLLSVRQTDAICPVQ